MQSETKSHKFEKKEKQSDEKEMTSEMEERVIKAS
jgi:hypothetical protein